MPRTRRKLFFRIVILAAVLLGAVSQQAVADLLEVARGKSVHVGPPSGTIYQLVADRKHSGLWYATKDRTFYRSEDAGRRWKESSLHNVWQIAVDPAGSIVYVLEFSRFATSEKKLWQSHDLGKSFDLIRLPNDFSVDFIFPSLRHSGQLFAISYASHHIQFTNDSGRTWTALPNTFPYRLGQVVNGCKYTDLNVESLLVSPFSDSAIYASLNAHGYGCVPTNAVVVSKDFGQTWQTIITGNGRIWFHWDAAFPDRAFAYGSLQQLYLLTEGGSQQIASSIYLERLLSVPNRPEELYTLNRGTFYFGEKGVILKSSDSGHTWQELPLQIKGTITALRAVDDGQGGLLAGTLGGGLYYKNEDDDWTWRNRGFSGGNISAVASSSATVYAVAGHPDDIYDSYFLYRSDDKGKTWTDVSLNIPRGERIAQVAVSPTNPQHVIVHLTTYTRKGDYLLLSRDGGKTWQRISAKQRFFISSNIVFHPSNPNVVLFTSRRWLYKSTRGGLNPKRFSKVGGGRIIIDPNNDRTIYFAGDDHVFKSMDAGRTVQRVEKGIERDIYGSCVAEDMTPLPQRDAFLLITCQSVVYRTTDGGAHWQRLSSIPVYLNHNLRSSGQRIQMVSANRALAFDNKGLFESVDAGKSWRSLNRELRLKRYTVIHDITDPRRAPFYVATSRGLVRLR